MVVFLTKIISCLCNIRCTVEWFDKCSNVSDNIVRPKADKQKLYFCFSRYSYFSPCFFWCWWRFCTRKMCSKAVMRSQISSVETLWENNTCIDLSSMWNAFQFIVGLSNVETLTEWETSLWSRNVAASKTPAASSQSQFDGMENFRKFYSNSRPLEQTF